MMKKLEDVLSQLSEIDAQDAVDDQVELIRAKLDPDLVVEQGQSLVEKLLAEQLGVFSSPAAALAERSKRAERNEEELEERELPIPGGPCTAEELGLSLSRSIPVYLSMEPCLQVERAEFYRVVEEHNEVSPHRTITVLGESDDIAMRLAQDDGLFVGVLGWNSCGLAKPAAAGATGHPCSAAIYEWKQLGFPRALFLHRLGPAQFADLELQNQVVLTDEQIHASSDGRPVAIQTFSDEGELTYLLESALSPSRPTARLVQTENLAGMTDDDLVESFRFVIASVERDAHQLIQILEAQDASPSQRVRQEAVGRRLDALYTTLGDESHRVELLRSCNRFTEGVVQKLGQLLEAERRVWEPLKVLADAEAVQGSESLSELLRAFSGRRMQLLAKLSFFQQVPLDKINLPPATQGLRRAVENFTRADRLTEQSSWRELVSFGEESLGVLLRRAKGGAPLGVRLRTSLWRKLDLVVVEDLAMAQLQAPPRDLTRLRFFHLVRANQGNDHRFEAVWQAVRESASPRPEVCESYFQRCNAYTDETDIKLMLRVLLVTATCDRDRDLAARHIPMASLWSLVAYSNAPWKVLEAVSRRIRTGESERLGRVFFDAVHSRLREAIGNVVGEGSWEPYESLVLELFCFDFFVETEYFGRLVSLVNHLIREGGASDQLRRKLLELRRARDGKKEIGESSTRQASNFLNLPLGVHRYLAAEPGRVLSYIDFPDPRIAKEACKHVTREKILKVLAKPNIHPMVLDRILKKRAHFTTLAAILAALQHPNCFPWFAQEYLERLSAEQLRRLAWSNRINARVKSLAMSKIGNRARRRDQPWEWTGHLSRGGRTGVGY